MLVFVTYYLEHRVGVAIAITGTTDISDIMGPSVLAWILDLGTCSHTNTALQKSNRHKLESLRGREA